MLGHALRQIGIRAITRTNEAHKHMIESETARNRAAVDLETTLVSLEEIDTIREEERSKIVSAKEAVDRDRIAAGETADIETVLRAEQKLKAERRRLLAERALDELENPPPTDETDPLVQRIDGIAESVEHLDRVEEWKQEWFKKFGVTTVEELPENYQDLLVSMEDEILTAKAGSDDDKE